MSGLFGSGQGTPMATQQQRANGLQIQSSSYGKGLPIVYGRARTQGELIWYGDFQAVEHKQQTGKGGGGGNSVSYTYSSSFMLALCEGAVKKLGKIWKGSGTVSLAQMNGTFKTGAAGQTPWSHFSGAPATTDNLSYPFVSWAAFLNVKLGSSPSAPNLNFEVYGLLPFSSTIDDAEPSAIITDLMTSGTHGIGFNALGSITQYRDYCTASGLFISPVVSQETSMSKLLGDLLQITNSTAYWTGGELRLLPWSDESVTGNGVTFTPDLTVRANLTADDFLKPIQIERKPLADLYNVIRVEYIDRANNYRTSVAEAKDQADIDLRGVRSLETIQAHPIMDPTVAQKVAQQILQRQLYIRNTYTTTLTMEHFALEPGDIVTLSDDLLGLSSEPVRITAIRETSGMALELTCQEFPAGVSEGAAYGNEGTAGFIPDVHAAPDATQPAAIFRAPQFLETSGPEVWVGVSGAGPDWGGAHVWASFDNTTYEQIGTVLPGTRYGTLSAALATGSDPDTVNSFGIGLDGPGSLNGGSQTAADNMQTLILVDEELISYETTVLNTDGTYTLGNGYMRRGCYGTAIASHAVGAPWMRIDDHIFKWRVDPSLVGTGVYFKFQGFNLYGGGEVDLSTVTAEYYTIGSAAEIPDTPATPTTFAVTAVADGVNVTWDNPNPAAVAMTSVERSTDGSTWTVLGQVQGEVYHDGFTTGALYYYRVRARSPAFQWSSYTSGLNAQGKTVQDGSTKNLTPTAYGSANLFPDPGATNSAFYSVTSNGAWTLDGSGGVVSPTLAANSYSTTLALDGTGAYVKYQGPEIYAGQSVTVTGTIKAVTGTGIGTVGLKCLDASGAVVTGGYLTFGEFASGTHTRTTVLPAGTVSVIPYLSANGGASGGSATISNFAIRLGAQTAADPGGKKTYIDFGDNISGGHLGKHGGNIPTSGTVATTLDHAFTKSSPSDANDATAIAYSTGGSVDSLKPAEAGAEPTTGKSLTVLIDRNMGNIADDATSGRYGAIHDSTTQGTMKSNSDRAGSGLDTSGNVVSQIGGASDAAATATSSDFAGVTGTTKPADNATVGAQAGVNLKDSTGTSLADADVITSQGTSSDTSNVNGVASATVSQGAGRANSAIDSTNIIVPTGIDLSRSYTGKHGGNIPTSGTVATTLDHAFTKGSPTDANDATAISYSTGGSVDSLKPAVAGSTKNLTPTAYGSANLFPDPGATNAAFYNVPGSGAWTLDGAGGVTSPVLAASAGSVTVALDGTGAFLTYQGPEIYAGQSVTLTGTIKAVTGTGTGSVGLKCQNASGAVVTGGFLTFGNFASGTHTLTTTLPLGTVSVSPYLYANGGASGGSATISNFAIRLGTHTLSDPEGAQLGDARQVRGVTSSNVQYYLTGFSSSANTNSSGVATVNVGSGTLLMGGSGTGNVSYNSSSINNLAATTTYYLYYIDPGFAGGSQTLHATTTKSNLTNTDPNVIYLGYITTPAAGATGGGSLGGCVSVYAHLDTADGSDVLAGDAAQGLVLNTRDDAGAISTAPIKNVPYEVAEPCVRISTANGSLTLSDMTPINCKIGPLPAYDVLGEEVWTSANGGGWEVVTDVQYVMPGTVMRISLGGLSYGAGDQPGYFIYSHNSIKP